MKQFISFDINKFTSKIKWLFKINHPHWIEEKIYQNKHVKKIDFTSFRGNLISELVSPK